MLKKHEMAGRQLYNIMIFVDLKKAFDHVPKAVIWRAFKTKSSWKEKSSPIRKHTKIIKH